MPVRPPIKFSGKNAKPFEIIVNAFKKGTITLLDEGRIPQDGVYVSQNMMLDQDGVWRVRYGTYPYGKSLTGPIDGIGTATIYATNGTQTSYLFAMDNGSLKYSQDGGNWTTVTGNTWTAGNQTQLLQINSRLYIVNGKDNLAYLDLSSFTIVTYSSLSTPGTVTLTPTTSLTSGTRSYNIYYRITAVKNSIGETAASAEATTTVNKIRDNWTDGTDSVSLSWSAVTGADSYNIYYSDQPSSEVWIASTNSTTYLDSGQTTPNIFQAYPTTDGTSGPPFSVVRWSDNRMWLCGDPNHPYRVWVGGQGNNLNSLNPFYGAAAIDLNLGSDERVMDIQHYRDGKGNQVATVFTASPSGGGSVWFLTLATLTVGSTTVTYFQPVSQGTIGTTSIRGQVQANNNVYYPSIRGFQSLGSAPNIINVIMTQDISAIIRPTVQGISNSAASSICGIYYYGRIYWSVPYGSSTNNQIWVLDLERQAWTLPWSIGVKQFLQYASSDGTVHLLAIPISGNQLIEISQSFQGDSGAPFSTNLESGLIFFDKNHFSWAWVQKVYVELGRPKGNINFSVSGTTASKDLSVLKSLSITDTVSSSGFGDNLFGQLIFGQSKDAPRAFSQASVKKVIYVNKILNNLTWQLTSSDVNQNYSLLQVGIVGNLLPQGDPSSWRK